jgi:hypothetical protein
MKRHVIDSLGENAAVDASGGASEAFARGFVPVKGTILISVSNPSSPVLVTVFCNWT